ncbi:MAG: hypothetical protein R2849_23175, partial [Thermomicrobiales bacterium]
GLPRPSGAGCDIGAVEVQTASQQVLCANQYTGQLVSPRSGVCASSLVELEAPDSYPMTFCVNPYTGAVRYAANGNCGYGQPHVVPDDGNLFTCVNPYTGANRWVETYGACLPHELPNLVPAEAYQPI